MQYLQSFACFQTNFENRENQCLLMFILSFEFAQDSSSRHPRGRTVNRNRQQRFWRQKPRSSKPEIKRQTSRGSHAETEIKDADVQHVSDATTGYAHCEFRRLLTWAHRCFIRELLRDCATTEQAQPTAQPNQNINADG